MATLSNIKDYNSINESSAMDNYNTYLSIRSKVNEISNVYNMVQNLCDIEDKFEELKNYNFFDGNNRKYKYIMSTNINSMKSIIESNEYDENNTFKFYSYYGNCVDAYNKVKEE